jgi:hypothetical protein
MNEGFPQAGVVISSANQAYFSHVTHLRATVGIPQTTEDRQDSARLAADWFAGAAPPLREGSSSLLLSSCALDGPAFYRSSICFVITAGVFSSLAASDLFWPFIPCSPPPLYLLDLLFTLFSSYFLLSCRLDSSLHE